MKNINMNLPGSFITFEGIECSGKTTLINHIYNFYKKNEIDVVLTREPFGTNLKDNFRSILDSYNKKNLNNQLFEYLLFSAERCLHIEEIILPALKRGAIILCDRYYDSSIACQNYNNSLSEEKMQFLYNWISHENKVNPTLTVYCKVSCEIALYRMNKRNENNSFDEKFKNKLDLISNKYDQIFKDKNNIIYLNTNNEEKIIIDNALKEISNKLLTLKNINLPF